jgi:haloalkane dehalogenase
MKVLRTPEDRFGDLPGFSFSPHYLEVEDTEGGSLRIHHLDEGPREGPIVLCLHGEPSWSFLYRKMIPIFTAAGFRVIAPDFPGFGRSDKPTQQEDFTYARFVAWIWQVIEKLALKDITLFCQDWGGLIGLRLVGEHPERFARVVAANTFLPSRPISGEAFLKWQAFSQKANPFNVGRIIQSATTTDLSPQVQAAYDAPFPDESYKAAARRFPMLVPTRADDPALVANGAAWDVLKKWEKPFLTLFGDSDPIMAGAEEILKKKIPGAAGQPHQIIEGGGHFIQEDRGEVLAGLVVDWMTG